MNRLEQDAADALQAHEDRRKAWGERAKADWQRNNRALLVGRIVFPELSEADKQQRANDIKAGRLPF